MLLYQLTRPIAFRQIKHPALRIINVYVPGGLAVLAIFLFLLLPLKPKLFGDDSITSNALLFISVLPGFFIAALAAVATFPSDSLNEIMPAPAPTLVMRTGDKLAPVELTSRIFLCHLFSYLTVLSFAGFLLGAGSDLLAPTRTEMLATVPRPISTLRETRVTRGRSGRRRSSAASEWSPPSGCWPLIAPGCHRSGRCGRAAGNCHRPSEAPPRRTACPRSCRRRGRDN